MKTIEAMKQAVEILNSSTPTSDVDDDALTVLREAMAREEAQSVEPVGYADQHGRLYDIKVIKALMVNTADMIPVYTHPAPDKRSKIIEKSQWINDLKPVRVFEGCGEPEPTGEREALIKRLRDGSGIWPASPLERAAADMLAADALVPMTEAQIDAVCPYESFSCRADYARGVRAAEAHHGIKPQGDSNARKVD